jgi:transposase
MARQRLRLQPHLSPAQLKRRYRTCRDAKEARRWQALWLVSQGARAQQAAQTVGFDASWVRQLIHRYNAQGPGGLLDGHRARPGGPRPRLTPAQQEQVRQALREPPAEGGLWSGPKVARWMARQTGRPTHPQLGWVYLRRLDHTLQVPRPQQTKAASPAEQEAWGENGAPR